MRVEDSLSCAGAAPWVVERCTPRHDAELRRLLRERPMGGAIRLSLEREPDTRIAAAVEGERDVMIAVRKRGSRTILGMGSRVVRRVWLNGEPAKLGYLGQLRIEPGATGRRRLSAAFEALEKTRAADELPFDVTSVVADNTAARRLLERGLPGLPIYEPLGEYVTLLIPARRPYAPKQSPDVRAGRPDDLPAIADCLQRNLRRYQLAPVWTEADLRSPVRTRNLHSDDFHVLVSGDRVAGCAARWDQRAFKQAVVRGYAPTLTRWRPAMNLGLRLLGRPQLPAPGTALRLVYLSHLAVDDDRIEAAIQLVDAARGAAADRGIAHLVVGLSVRHPFLRVLERRYAAYALRSVLYVVHRPERGQYVVGLKGCTPHLEVATL